MGNLQQAWYSACPGKHLAVQCCCRSCCLLHATLSNQASGHQPATPREPQNPLRSHTFPHLTQIFTERYKRGYWDLKAMIGPGGMPSSHSSLCSVSFWVVRLGDSLVLGLAGKAPLCLCGSNATLSQNPWLRT